jgi:hypothetical protein
MRNYSKEIVEQYEGIIPYHQIFYIRAIKFAAERAYLAFARFNNALAGTNKNQQEIVFSIQEALGHCAAVSRFFWPSAKDPLAIARANNLKKTFNIIDGNPLQSRAIRNRVEHFDERLDEFLSYDPTGSIYDFAIGSKDLSQGKASHILLLLDIQAQVVILFGKEYPFSGLLEETKRIYELAYSMDS